jgi:F420-dependent oxidoreductase-like protein
MKEIGIGIGVVAGGGEPLDDVIERFVRAEEAGFQSAWIPNIFGYDALTVSALAGKRTGRIEIGTAVVPTYSRHPFYMAQQALTTAAACGGRFVLGLGPSYKVVIENMLGLSFDKPARHVREFTSVVRSLIDTGKTDFSGEGYRVTGSLDAPGGSPCPILIGGLGPLMRRIAGAVVDGSITWMTGPRTLAETIVPDVRAAAVAAGRPAPRIVAGFPVVLTDDPAGAREVAANLFSIYGTLPSYRAMLDAEGAAGPGDIVVAGDERAIEAAIASLASSGVTDFHAAVFPTGPDARASLTRTTELLADLARR